MRDRYEPPTRPETWPPIPPVQPAPGTSGLFDEPDWDPYYPAWAAGPADEAREQGLRRLAMLTVHATGLSVVTAIGFATVFASTAHAQSGSAAAARPTPGPATVSGTPSPGPVHQAHKKKHHRQAAATTAPATTAPGGSAAPAAPASAPSLAPPATPPAAAPPSPAPAQTTSSGSVPA
jgi:hypothetical protein